MKIKYILSFFLVVASFSHASVLEVTTLADDSFTTGTLREAMANAQNGDTIEFNSSLSGTIILGAVLPTLPANASISIVGPSSNSISISGNSSCRIFEFDVGTYTISHLNLVNGVHANQGGAVHVLEGASVYLSNVNITPAGTGSSQINSVYIEGNGVVYFEDAHFTSSSGSQIFLSGSYLECNNTTAQSYIINGSDGGQIVQNGLGTTTVSTPTSTTADYYIVASYGTIKASGNITQAASVSSGATLMGNFTGSYIVSQGTVQPGDTSNFGTITLSDEYYHIYGTTQVKINAAGSKDVINCGSIGISGGILNIVPASGSYTLGTKYTIMTCTNGINGYFGTVTAGGLDVQINYFTNSIEVEIIAPATI